MKKQQNIGRLFFSNPPHSLLELNSSVDRNALNMLIPNFKEKAKALKKYL